MSSAKKAAGQANEESRPNENGRSSVSSHEAKDSSRSNSSTPAPFTNGHDRSRADISVCRDSDGDSSVADDSLCSTPTAHRTFKVPTQRPRTSKSEKKRRVSSASFSHEHSRVMDLEKEVRKLLAERNQLSKQLYTSKHDNTKLEGRVQVAVRDKSALLSQMASLSKDNRELSRGKRILLAKAFSSVDARKTRSLQQSLKQANREKRSKQKELDKLNIQMNMTSKQMQERLLASLDEREEMETRIEDLECEVQHLNECLAAGEEATTVLKVSLTSHEETCQSLKDRHTQLELTCQEKDKELCEVRERLTTEGEQLTHTLHTAQETTAKLEQTISSLQEKLSESSREISSLQTQLQSTQLEVEKERGGREGAEGELSQCREQLGEVGQRVDSLEKSAAELSQMNSDLQALLKSTQSEVETERGGRERAEGELSQCREQLGEVGQKVDSLEKSAAESSQMNSDLQEQLKSTQSEVEVERGGRERAEGDLSQCREQLGEVGQRVDSLEKGAAELSQMNSDLQAQLKSLKVELEGEKSHRLQAEGTLSLTTAQLSNQTTEMERMKLEHTETLESAHTRCSTLVSELEKAVSEGKETQAMLQRQITAVETDREEALRAAEEVREREETMTSQLQQLTKENTQLQDAQHTTLEQLEVVQDKLAALQEQIDGSAEVASGEAAVQEKLTIELQEVHTRLIQQETHTTKVKNEMGERILELEEELERMKMEREQLEMAYLDLQEKCRPFQDQLEGLTDVNALLQSQAALAKKEAQEVSDQFASLVGHQNSRQKIRYVKKIRDENTALKMEINQLRMELSKQKKQMRRFQNENKPGPTAANLARPLTSKN